MNKPTPEQTQYWASESFPAWSATVTLLDGLSYESFRETVNQTATQQQHRYTGLITRESDGSVTSFTHTLYPRRKYPMPALGECADGMAKLAESLGVPVEANSVQEGFYRAPIGLYVGQQDVYETAPEHSIESVQAKIALRGMRSVVAAADVFTVRFTKDGVDNYTEPVAVVNGPLSEVGKICMLAVDLGQERFTLEQSPVYEQPTVQMIETIHCQEPEWR